MFNNDPDKFKHGNLDTRMYKHPKYCYYIKDQNVIYKVIGYYYNFKQYKIQSTTTKEIKYVDCFEIAGIWDRLTVDNLKKRYG